MSNYSVFSETSPVANQFDQSNLNQNVNQSGGFLNNIFGQNNNKYENLTDLVNDSINGCKMEVTDYLLSRKFVPDLTRNDSNGNNLLHNLILAHNKGSQLAYKALTFILSSSDIPNIESALNKQNNQGDTPLHYAIRYDLDTIVSLMMMKGAKRMKNKDGFEPQTDMEESETYTVITVSGNNVGDLRDLFRIDEDSVLERTEMERSEAPRQPVSKMETIREDSKDLPSIFSTQKTVSKVEETGSGDMDLLLKQFQELTRGSRKVQESKKTYDVGKLLDEQGVGTTEFKDYVGERKGSMTGGSRNKISGFRLMKKNTDSEFYEQYGGESEYDKLDVADDADVDEDDEDDMDMDRELAMMAREAVNQKGKLHEEAIEKVMKHLKDSDKNDLNARTIKSLVYGEVKEEKPELGGLDRATEMVKRITKKKVEELMKTKKFKELKLIIENKMKEKQQRKETKNSDTKKSDTKKSDTKKKTKQSRMVEDSERYNMELDDLMDEELGFHESDSDYMKDSDKKDNQFNEESSDDDLPKIRAENLGDLESEASGEAEFDEDKEHAISDDEGELDEVGELPKIENNKGDDMEETSMLSSLEETEYKFF